MINKENITNIVNNSIQKLNDEFPEKGVYLVEINISNDNKISVHVDSFKGISVDECVFISKSTENELDREENDFSLIVSSAGLDQPFKVQKQYEKSIGKQVKIKIQDRNEFKAVILSVDRKGIEVEETKKKKKEIIKTKIYLDFNIIKTVKPVITFK